MTKQDAWQHIKGNEYLKRAVEVALTGNHKITVFGNPDNGECYLKIILGDLLTFRKPCKCGNFTNFKELCDCDSDAIIEVRRSNKHKKALLNPIVVKLESPSTFDYNKSGEDFETVINRMAKTTQFIEVNNFNNDMELPLHKQSEDILSCAIKRLNLTLCRVERIKSVAKTIALMDNHFFIEPYHISEAIQYNMMDGVN